MKEPAKPLVIAAGGIVVREAAVPLIGVVRLRKDKSWVLPKGKLKAGETALDAARREVLEETGHQVSVHEFLGTMTQARERKLKVVQFWRMSAVGGPSRALMDDVKAVKWLPLDQAIKILTHAHEQTFLAQVGPIALDAARQSARNPSSASPPEHVEAARATFAETMRAWLRRLVQGRVTRT